MVTSALRFLDRYTHEALVQQPLRGERDSYIMSKNIISVFQTVGPLANVNSSGNQ